LKTREAAMMFDLSGKTALVTGASGGIGGAIATALQGQGAKVALSGTRIQPLEELAARLGGSPPVLIADLASATAALQLARDAEQALGRLDILVNNAGMTRDALLLRMSDEDWSQVLEVNLTAAFRLARAALRGMMKRRHGRIINITSIVGVTGNPGQANYAAAKAGMIGFAKSLAQEVASRGITVNCIAPGFITSAMTDVLSDQQKSRLLAGIPAGRMGEASEIAAAAVYLASTEADYVSGQTLHVNGGMAMI
jgi:3-oxoacyl-[acyl-carrier protein] reductase